MTWLPVLCGCKWTAIKQAGALLCARAKPIKSMIPQQFDQSTYYGRLRRFMAITDPRMLFKATDANLAKAKRIVQEAESAAVLPQDLSEIWKSKRLVESTIHPDTGEPILLPFRMSAFVPTNLPIVAGMLLPNPSVETLSEY